MARIKVLVSDLNPDNRISPEDHVVVKLIVNGRAMRPLDVDKVEIPELLGIAVPARKPLTDQGS